MENAKNIRHVYADNAATTAMSTAALEKMIWALENQYGNPSSLHTVGQEAKVYLEYARARVAKCLGAADPREIIFTGGGSAGHTVPNIAIISDLLRRGGFRAAYIA